MKRKIKNNIPYQFVNETKKDEHVLTISGAIGESGWFYDATSADDVRNALGNVKASTIRIMLNSGGGDCMDGIEIYNYLKDLEAHVIVEVTALAGSAASIIAMGADEVIMRTGATMMVHEASTFAYGTKSDIQKTMNALEAIDQSIVEIYVQKTGLSHDEIKDMIVAETWLTAEEALKKGFATSIEQVVDNEPKEPSNHIDDALINNIVELVTSKIENQIPKKEPMQLEAEKPSNTRTRFLF